jgi:hypothetical protein
MADIKQQWNDFSNQIVGYYTQAYTWLETFFKQIDTYEIIAVVAIGVGLIMVIIGFILL